MKILFSWFKTFPFFLAYPVIRGLLFAWLITTFIIGLAGSVFAIILLFGSGPSNKFIAPTDQTIGITLNKDIEELQQMDIQIDSMEKQLDSFEQFRRNYAPPGKCSPNPLADTANSVQVVINLEAGNANPREFIINKLDYVRGRCFTNQSPYTMSGFIPLDKNEKVLNFHTELFSEEDNIATKLSIEVYSSKKELIGKYPSNTKEGKGTIKAFYPFPFTGTIKLKRVQQDGLPVTANTSRR